MTIETELPLYEEVLLLALDDEKGTTAFGSMYGYAVGGGMLAELLLRERLAVEGEGRKAKVVVRNRQQTGDPLLDEALARVQKAKRLRSPAGWVQAFTSTRDLEVRIAKGLARRGVLRSTEDEVLFFFTRKVWPALEHGPERRIRERIERAVTTDEDLDPRTIVLVTLARSTGLLAQIVDKKTLKARKERLDRIAKGEVAGEAARAAMEAAQAAVIAATVAASVAASSAAVS